MQRKSVLVRLDEELWRRLDDASKDTGLSKQWMLVAGLRMYLDHVEKTNGRTDSA